MILSIVTCGLLAQVGATVGTMLGCANAVVMYGIYWILRGVLGPNNEIIKFVGIGDSTDFAAVRHFLSVIIATMSLLMFGYQSFLLRNDRPPAKIILPCIPPLMAGSVIGAWVLDEYGTQKWIPPLLGSFFGLFALAYLVINAVRGADAEVEEDLDKVEDVWRSKTFWGLFLSAFPSGFAGGALSVAGMPIIVASLACSFSKKVSRATFPVFFFIAMSSKLSWTAYSGDLGVSNGTTFGIYFLAFLTGTVTGTYIGNYFGNILTTQTYRQTVAFALLVSAIVFMELPALVLIVATLCFIAYQMYRQYAASAKLSSD